MQPNEFNLDTIINWAKTQLKFAQRDFAKSPTSTRWNCAVRCMFVYQQADYALRSACVDRSALLEELAGKPQGHWDDIISRATTGKSVRDNVKFTI
jgi:hypothetical protein